MSRTARSRSAMPAVLASVLVGTVPLVSACGAGQNAPTRLEYSVADGVQANAGNVVLRNLQLVADVGDTQGGATELDLTGLVANNSGTADTLQRVTAADGTSATKPFTTVTPSAGPASASTAPSASAVPSASAAASGSAGAAPSTTLAPGATLLLGSDGLDLQVSGLKTAVLPGSLVSLSFSFKNSGSVTVAVPVYSLNSRSNPEPTPSISFPAPDVPDIFNPQPYDNAAGPSS